MDSGNSYEPNAFRGNLPDSIRAVSPDLYVFLRELIQELRAFTSQSLHGGLRIAQNELTTRYVDRAFPLDSRAAVQLQDGRTAFAQFIRFPSVPTPGNTGRLIFRRNGREYQATGAESEFAGIDYTRTGAGLHGWIVVGGYAPINPGLYEGSQPALVGVKDGKFDKSILLKWGVVDQDSIYLMPPFGVAGEDDEDSLAALVVRLTEMESEVASLRGDLDGILEDYGQFQGRAMRALSRLESRNYGDELQSLFQEYVQQTDRTVALVSELAVGRQYLDALTERVIGYTNAAQTHVVRAESYERNAQFWSGVAETRSIVASGHSDRATAQALIASDSAVQASDSAAQAQMTLTAMASVGIPGLVENADFDIWPDGAMMPANWQLGSPELTIARVVGLNTPYSMRVFRPADTYPNSLIIIQNASSQDNPVLNRVAAGWYVIQGSFIIESGTTDGHRIRMHRKNDGAYVGDTDIHLSDLQSGGTPVGAGIPGEVYRFSRLVDLTTTSVDDLTVTLVVGTPGEPLQTSAIIWESLSVRVATEAEIATRTVLMDAVAQLALFQNTVNLVANEQTTQATSITNLRTEVNGFSANINTLQESVDGVEARYGVTLDVNGDLTGFELLGGGGQSAFNVRADRFNIRTSDGLKQLFSVSGNKVEFGTDLHIRQHRIIYDNGTFMRVNGTGFGVGNQFLDWFGPSKDVSQCDKTTASFYLTVHGDAYFGGSLTAGTLKNGITSSNTAQSVTADTGVFGSNGNSINVVVSWTYQQVTNQTYPATLEGQQQFDQQAAFFNAQDLGGGFWEGEKIETYSVSTVTLYRSINGGPLANVSGGGSETMAARFTGNRPVNGADPGTSQITRTQSVNYTYTDPALSTQDRRYQAVLSRAIGNAGIQTQRLSVTAIEE